jgi:hypothetical protein
MLPDCLHPLCGEDDDRFQGNILVHPNRACCDRGDPVDELHAVCDLCKDGIAEIPRAVVEKGVVLEVNF